MIAGAFDGKYIEHKNSSDEKITIKKYFEYIRPYLRDMSGDLKTSDEWKINLIMKTDFVSTTGLVEYRDAYSVSDNSKIKQK